MDLRGWFRTIPGEYADHLAVPKPQRAAPGPRWALLGVLLLAAFLPRAILAVRTQVICPDGALYISLAEALDRGDLHAGLREVRLNTYPALLLAFHRLGWDLETAGKWWGVVAASLVVLPLFGWARRQFDDRVALVACLLYATHGNFIEWTPEVLRDPTFWLLFMLSVYLLWRAVTEVRLVWFAAGGVAVTLALLTRVEGALLVVPLLVWSLGRWLALREERWRIPAGVALCLGLCPAMVVAANLVWLRGHDRWEVSRLTPILLVERWFRQAADPAVAAASPPSTESLLHAPPSKSPWRLTWTFLNTMERGLTPVFGALMLTGMWRRRKIWLRREHQASFYAAMLLTAGIWIHVWCTQVPSFRYPLPIVLLGSVFASLALLGASARLVGWAERWSLPRRWQHAAAVAPLVIVAAVGLADSLTRNYARREACARLGRWVGAEYPRARMVSHADSWMRVAGLYAGAETIEFADDAAVQEVAAIVRQTHPDVILLPRCRLDPRHYPALLDEVSALGYRPVEDRHMPPGSEHLAALSRVPPRGRAPREPCGEADSALAELCPPAQPRRR
jgi:hypothetical protein